MKKLFQGLLRPVDALVIGSVGLVAELLSAQIEILPLILFVLLIIDALVLLVGTRE